MGLTKASGMLPIGCRPIGATTAYYAFEGFWSLFHATAFTLTLLYQVQVAHLSPLQLILVGSVMEGTAFVFEIPTGIVADLYSRRLSALIGTFVVGVGILIQGMWPTFGPILAAQVVWALGYTFISGALDAWITDEVGEQAVHRLFTRAQQQRLALTVVGALVAGGLAQLNLQLPMLVAGTGYVLLAAVMCVVMPENGFLPASREKHHTPEHLKRTLRAAAIAARAPGVVRSFMVIALLSGAASEVFDRLWTAHIITATSLTAGSSSAHTAMWFTGFALVGSLVALAVSLLANRVANTRVNVAHPAGLLSGLIVVQVMGVVGFALFGALWPMLITMWVRDSARAVGSPIQAAWLNRNVEPRTRATTLSLTSQADAIGQVVGGPPLGVLANRTSVPVALIASAGFLAPTAIVFSRLRVGRAHRGSVADRTRARLARTRRSGDHEMEAQPWRR